MFTGRPERAQALMKSVWRQRNAGIWMMSATSPQYMPSFTLNRTIAEKAEAYGFIARIIDNGDPGSTDRFGLRVTSPSGSILLDLTFDPIQLSGGNFSVPKLTGK